MRQRDRVQSVCVVMAVKMRRR